MDTTFSEIVDRPLDDPAADTLGRVAFARRVAAELLAWNSREPLVVSRNGEPGCGKTTMKNFIRHRLAAAAPTGTGPIVIEFNPWHSAPGDPGCNLCLEMAEQLDLGGATPARAALALAWRRLAAAFSGDHGGAAPSAPSLRSLHGAIRD